MATATAERYVRVTGNRAIYGCWLEHGAVMKVAPDFPPELEQYVETYTDMPPLDVQTFDAASYRRAIERKPNDTPKGPVFLSASDVMERRGWTEAQLSTARGSCGFPQQYGTRPFAENQRATAKAMSAVVKAVWGADAEDPRARRQEPIGSRARSWPGNSRSRRSA
jgi:hypothetical protein